jgi:hypothetical protein
VAEACKKNGVSLRTFETPEIDIPTLDTFVGRPDPDSAFATAQHLLKDVDIAFCNLETVVADAKYLEPPAPQIVKDIQNVSARFGTTFEVSKDDVAVTLGEAS